LAARADGVAGQTGTRISMGISPIAEGE